MSANRADVEVRRSARRRRTVTAFREAGRIVVAIPAGFSPGQEEYWVDRMVARLERSDRRRRLSDAQLQARCRELSDRYLGGRAVPAAVSWVGNQNQRWGSCTPADGTIRISDRLMTMPPWVLDYVLMHELAHLLQWGHGPDFWALLQAYPHTERARGFLQGVTFASARGMDEDGSDPVDDPELDPVDDLEADPVDDPDAVPLVLGPRSTHRTGC